MTISFSIEYHTNWGEDIRVAGPLPELGGGLADSAFPLHTLDGIHWTALIEIENPQPCSIPYGYQVYRDGHLVRCEWHGLPRLLHVDGNPLQNYRLQDSWHDLPEQSYFYTSAFTASILARPERDDFPSSYSKGIRIKAYAPTISPDCCLAICGNQPIFGDWDPNKAVLMSDANYPEWQAEVDASTLSFPLEYKFVLYNKKEARFVAWENNPNRYLADPQQSDNETLVIGDRYVYFNRSVWKGAGVAVPVFSLRSEGSFGVGDFGDLKRMVDWAVATSQQVVQVLPVNDTTLTHTWTDSYPYNSISIYALHPMYVDIRQLTPLNDVGKMAEFEQCRLQLNALPTVDYAAVNQAKWNYLRLLFEQEGEQVLQSEVFMNFFEKNKEWLQPYAAYSYLRDCYHTPDFNTWPQYAVYEAGMIEQLCQPGTPTYHDIAIYYYVQFCLHLQLLDVTNYARANGVILKGDIPIGISRHSVEAWKEPYLFNMNGQAGAPPDAFSVNGQNWGFPTYNWEAMAKDGYDWWRKRFCKLAEYFDAYRIDHILGFFRIWEIPMHAVHGLLGQFVPSLPLSREEIEGVYGLPFREDFFLKPYIHERFLQQMFGPHTSDVKQTFLEPTTVRDIYRMRPEFDTQRKVEVYFDGKVDADSIGIRDGLYALISDVLFLSDRDDPNRYHPRIAVQYDHIYQALNDLEKAAFNRLYDDYFYRRHNEFWRQQAMKKLPNLTQATRMLVCAEDLGMIPDCVSWVMNDLRILSLEIQRMPKDPLQEFGDPGSFPYRSVCTISTHDMSTLRGWWEEDKQQTQRYYNNMLRHDGVAPQEATPELCQEIIYNHLCGNSMLCILSLQDWLSMDGYWRNPDVQAERINVPADSRHYWRYRMHITLEQLMQAYGLNDRIRMLIAQTGRGVWH